MEQPKPKQTDLNSAIADYLLKKGFAKALNSFKEELNTDPHSPDSPVAHEYALEIMLDVFYFTNNPA